jgi:putative DNA primase/helicase
VVDRDQIERAREADILAVAQRYSANLKRAGGCEFVGPCPVCGGHDRFSVNTEKRVWNCRKCGEGGDVIKFLQHVIGATFGEAIAILTGEKWTANIPPRRSGRDDDDRSCNDNGVLAARIWRSAQSIKGTLAERYLVNVPPNGRGIGIEQIADINDVLRFEPRCPFAGRELPCLVALVRNVVSDEPMGIIRTNLRSDWKKPERRALGPKKNGAIKLWEDAAVTTGLVIGEGMETVAAAAR